MGEGDAAANLGDRPIGRLHDVRLVGDQQRVRQYLPNGGLEQGARVDRHRRDLLAPNW